MRQYGHRPPHQLNSLSSFDVVRAAGAEGVELDVRRTADDALVLVHDHALEDGRLVDRTSAPELPGDVVHLETALDACSGMLVNIEIKNFPSEPSYDPSQRIADLVAQLLATRGGKDRVLASCFGVDCLDRLRASTDVQMASVTTVVFPVVFVRRCTRPSRLASYDARKWPTTARGRVLRRPGASLR